jgi:hypothetical protein
MAKRDDSIDACVEALKRVDDASVASLSHNPAAKALYEEVTSMSPSMQGPAANKKRSPRRATRRRRLLWQGALLVGAAAIVLAVLSIVNVFGANGPSIVEKAAAAIDPAKNVILHVKISGHEGGADGYSSDWTEEDWSRMSSPYTWRQIQAFPDQPVTDTVQDTNGLAQMYDAGTNSIYTQAAASMFMVAAGQAVPYGEMILELLRSGDAVVDGTETINGRECTRIVATKDYGTAPEGTKYGDWFYVDSRTNYPVEWKQTRDGGKVVDIRFDTYELLPANDANLAFLDLSAQHPGATISNTSLEDFRNSGSTPVTAAPGDPSDTRKP